MPSVEMTDQEWQLVLAILADRPWREVNGIVMKIGSQLQAQVRPGETAIAQRGIRLDSNGKEVRHE